MKISLRALAAGSFLTALTAAGLTAHPALAEAAGVDFWNFPDLRLAADRSAALGRDLDRQGEEAYHRTIVRYETVRDVAEGRLSFEEGVAQFVRLNRSAPAGLAHVRQLFAGDAEDTLAGWQLVGQLRVNVHLEADAVADAGACWLVERE
jgi:hypothetical protein